MKKTYLLVLLAVAIFSGCATTVSYKTYTISDFVINMSSDWKSISLENKTNGENFLAAFESPDNENTMGLLHVYVITAGVQTSAEQYANEIKSAQLNEYSNYRIVEEKQLLLEDKPTFHRIFTANENEKIVVTSQYFIKDEEEIYIITGRSTESSYDNYSQIFDNAAESFHTG